MASVVNAVRELVLDPAGEDCRYYAMTVFTGKDCQVTVARDNQHLLVKFVHQEGQSVVTLSHFLLDADSSNLQEYVTQVFLSLVVLLVELGCRLVSVLLVVG